jgi:hypothetical protein
VVIFKFCPVEVSIFHFTCIVSVFIKLLVKELFFCGSFSKLSGLNKKYKNNIQTITAIIEKIRIVILLDPCPSSNSSLANAFADQ